MGYSKDIKQEIFVKYVCGYTPKEIAEESGIHFVTIFRFKMLEQFLPILKN